MSSPLEWCDSLFLFFHPLFFLLSSPSLGYQRGKGGWRFSESISWGTKRTGMRVILGEYCDFDLSASSFFRSFKNSFFSLAIGRFFFFFFYQIFLRVTENPLFPSPAISDRSHTMITRQSKYHRARGRIVRFEGLLCIRLRGNKGRVSLSRLERNSSRVKSRDKSSRLSPLIYCESYLEGRGEGLAHLHLELS